MTIHCDGSGISKDGMSRIAVVSPELNLKILKSFKMDIPSKIVEALALVEALIVAPVNITVVSDHNCLVNQVINNHKVKKDKYLKKLVLKCKYLVEEKNIKVLWVLRKENLAGKLIKNVLNKRRRNEQKNNEGFRI